MNRQAQFHRVVVLGKTAVHQGAVAAWQITSKVSAEAARQTKIAMPIIREAARKAWIEIQCQAAAAKPIVQDVSKRAAVSAWEVSRRAGQRILALILRGLDQAIPVIRDLNQKFPLASRVKLVCAAGLFGAIVLVAAGTGRFSKPTPISAVQEEPQLEITESSGPIHPAVEAPIAIESPMNIETRSAEIPARQEPNVFVPSRRNAELEQQRQQAQLTLQQAANDYDYAVQQWNAEVAACQQSGPPAGYTPQQMGRFAAMGVRPPTQQRQPNEALLYAARQAEQRYLQARENYQRLAQAQ